MDWSFSYKIEHLFMGVRIIFNTWTHANDNSPAGVRSEDQDGVIDCSELTVSCGFHFVPLMHFQGVVSDEGGEVLQGISVSSVHIWHLRLVFLTSWLDERSHVTQRSVDLLSDSVHDGQTVVGSVKGGDS